MVNCRFSRQCWWERYAVKALRVQGGGATLDRMSWRQGGDGGRDAALLRVATTLGGRDVVMLKRSGMRPRRRASAAVRGEGSGGWMPPCGFANAACLPGSPPAKPLDMEACPEGSRLRQLCHAPSRSGHALLGVEKEACRPRPRRDRRRVF